MSAGVPASAGNADPNAGVFMTAPCGTVDLLDTMRQNPKGSAAKGSLFASAVQPPGNTLLYTNSLTSSFPSWFLSIMLKIASMWVMNSSLLTV